MLAFGITALGLFNLAGFWYFEMTDVPVSVVLVTAFATIACAYLTFFAASHERSGDPAGDSEPGFNQDISSILTEFSWRTVLAYIGFFGICLFFLYAWDHWGFLHG
jgi:hypothetical protein